MRRRDKEVIDRAWMDGVLTRGTVIYLGLASLDGSPYVVPMGYGYENGVIYLHGAMSGLKNEMIAANPKVSFNVSVDIALIKGKTGREFSYWYRSVTGFGEAREITDLSEKNEALSALMRHYDGPHDDLTASLKDSVWTAKILIKEIFGKSSYYPKP
jgi:nitroimidazol reductase NimA-like FMN-containing flavoprotein (pyridoxamine 5'-phosphate oxidase superfamily)